MSAITDVIEPIPLRSLPEDQLLLSELDGLSEAFSCLGEIYSTGSLLIEGSPQLSTPLHDLDIVVKIKTEDVPSFLSALRRVKRVREFGRLWPVRWQGVSTTLCPFFQRTENIIYTTDLEKMLSHKALDNPILVRVKDDLEGLYVPARLQCQDRSGNNLEVLIHNTLGVGLMKRDKCYTLKNTIKERFGDRERYHITEPIEQITRSQH